MQMAHALASALAKGVDRLDAQLLMLHALDTAPEQLGARRAWLIAHADDPLPLAARSRFAELIERRAAGEPLAYITGHKEFFGLALQVDPRVLIPRPDTEVLVEWAQEVLSAMLPSPPDALAALDLGTGSGAIALALKHNCADLQVDALDASAGALAVAQANADRLGLRIDFRRGDWFELVERRYHCIISNPPYVAAQDPHLEALSHEPAMALVSGPDGLQDIRQIVRTAPARLYDGGWLLVEHGSEQADAVQALFRTSGFQQIRCRRDLQGHQRCTGGRSSQK